ncbi:MFS general substrate transporter [Trichodelitschia bisporula]|uniref:MFS general substrate transporter n=1 Tax=Trichodelitschia bisporula TaxID=703511 RepID=A0A6G1HYK6_9PEZI|nr:MFS general substrate transporter [Trichodelitschia bisporula]
MSPSTAAPKTPRTDSHDLGHVPTSSTAEPLIADTEGERRIEYRLYKRRWFGLVQLVLLNIIVSWDWLTFSAVSKTSADYFHVSETAINWLSTAFFFAFVANTPATLYTLHLGPRPAILAASALVLLSNWLRYAGARTNHFSLVMFGQILVGLAQPFVLAAPTRYSDLWFSEKGRVSATAVASLANPFGGALGQLIGPMWATKPSEVPNMVLYTAIISSLAAIPSIFIPARPPTPASPSSSIPQTSLKDSVHILLHTPSFWLLFIPFSIYVGFFNATSSLLNQILSPYAYTESQAGIGGALLIVVGLVAAAILSPITDRTQSYLLPIKLLTPLIAAGYLGFVFAPPTRGLPAPYVLLSLLGAANFALVPLALEYAVELTWPAGPEVGSTVLWAGGQLLGAVFVIGMGAMKDEKGTWGPKGNMEKALVLQAVVAAAVVPFALLLGVRRWGFGAGRGRRAAGEA